MNQTSLRILRYSWVILFVWFGYQQLMHPDMWVGYLPTWVGYFPIPAEMIVQLNGWFEIVAAIFLAVGVWLKPVSIVLALHLFGIAITAGGAIGMRGIALAVSPADSWTIAGKSEKHKMKESQ